MTLAGDPDGPPGAAAFWDGAHFVGAKLALMRGADILTCLRDDVPHIPWPGHWDLPGGGREGGESPVECALRELGEEFGLQLAPARLTGRCLPSVSRPGRMAWLFTRTLTDDEIAAIRFGDEGQEWRMMPLADYLAHPKSVPHFRDMLATITPLL